MTWSKLISEPSDALGWHDWRGSSNWLRKGLYWLTAQSTPALLLRAYFMLALGAWLDIATGLQLSVFAFYFVPVFITSFLVSPRAGVFTSILAAGIRVAAMHLYPGHDMDLAVTGWNFCVDAVSFLIFAFLLASVREQLDREVLLARRDLLTGVHNRLAFIERVDGEIERMRRGGAPCTLLYLDIDNFKQLNDTRGHEAGDALLVNVAATLKKQLRAIDVVARLGGDEFAVLMPQTLAEGAHLALDRLQPALQSAVAAEGRPTTCSIGALTFDEAPASFDEALRQADQLMYRAKKSGKNRSFYGAFVAGHPLISPGNAPGETASLDSICVPEAH